MKKPLRIFIVYAREDSAYKDDLIKALSPLKNQGWVESWHDGDIRPGEAWDARIREQIEAADLILPLVSNDFFASEYIQNVEFRAAFERHQAGSCRIVPVIIRAGEWTADDRLAKLQALPEGGVPVGSWANRDEAFKSIAAGIRKLAQQEDWLPPVESHPDRPRRTMSWRLPVFLIGSILAILAAWNFARKSAEGAAEKNVSTAYHTAAATGTIPALRDFLKDCDSGPYADSARNAIMLFERKLDTLVLDAEALHKGGLTDTALVRLESARRINPADSRVLQLARQWTE